MTRHIAMPLIPWWQCPPAPSIYRAQPFEWNCEQPLTLKITIDTKPKTKSKLPLSTNNGLDYYTKYVETKQSVLEKSQNFFDTISLEFSPIRRKYRDLQDEITDIIEDVKMSADATNKVNELLEQKKLYMRFI